MLAFWCCSSSSAVFRHPEALRRANAPFHRAIDKEFFESAQWIRRCGDRCEADLRQQAQRLENRAWVETALARDSSVPVDRIQARVEKGWVTLSGELDWEHQRAAAANLAHPLLGIVGVNNTIELEPRNTPDHIGTRIRDSHPGCRCNACRRVSIAPRSKLVRSTS